MKHFRCRWNHPLRKAWRENTGYDAWYCWRDGLIAGTTTMLFVVILIMATTIFDEAAGAIAFLVVIPLTIGFAFGMIRLDPGETLSKVIRKAGTELGIIIVPDTPIHQLKELSEARLRQLAQELEAAETKVSLEPHVNARYSLRTQRREQMKSVNVLLRNLGLAEKKWDLYFKD